MASSISCVTASRMARMPLASAHRSRKILTSETFTQSRPNGESFLARPVNVMGRHRVRHDRKDAAGSRRPIAARRLRARARHWRRKVNAQAIFEIRAIDAMGGDAVTDCFISQIIAGELAAGWEWSTRIDCWRRRERAEDVRRPPGSELRGMRQWKCRLRQWRPRRLCLRFS